MTTTVKLAPTHRANIVKLVSSLISRYVVSDADADEYNHNYMSNCTIAHCVKHDVIHGLTSAKYAIDTVVREVKPRNHITASVQSTATRLFGADYWKNVVYMDSTETVYTEYAAGGKAQLKEVIKFIINRYGLDELNHFLYDIPASLPEGVTATTVYKAEDGQEFKTVEAAVKHNRDTAFRKEMMQTIGGGTNVRLYLDDIYDLNKFLLDNPKVCELIANYHNGK